MHTGTRYNLTQASSHHLSHHIPGKKKHGWETEGKYVYLNVKKYEVVVSVCYFCYMIVKQTSRFPLNQRNQILN